MSETYAHLYRLPQTGPALLHRLRPVGPARHGDVAVHQGDPRRRADPGVRRRQYAARLHLYRRHRHRRRRLRSTIRRPTTAPRRPAAARGPHRLYNIGNNRSEELMRMIDLIEQACGRKAETRAAADAARRRARHLCRHQRDPARPRLRSRRRSIDEGVPRFVDWYRALSRRLRRTPLRRPAARASSARRRRRSRRRQMSLRSASRPPVADQAARSARRRASRYSRVRHRGDDQVVAALERVGRRARRHIRARASSGSASGSWTVTSWPSALSRRIDVDHLAVAQVGHILLEGEAHAPGPCRPGRRGARGAGRRPSAPMPSLIARPARMTSRLDGRAAARGS